MKLLFTNVRLGRAHERRSDGAPTPPTPATSRGVEASTGNDDSLGRGMDAALTILVFLGIGWLVDRWLGVFPAFTIGLVLFAAVGTFVRMKYTYDARMEQLEADRAARRRSTVVPNARTVSGATPADAGAPADGPTAAPTEELA